MKILVQSAHKGASPVVVDLPDHITDGLPFNVDVDGRKYLARWSRASAALHLRRAADVNHPGTAHQDTAHQGPEPMLELSIPVRGMRTVQFPGDAEARCSIECFLPDPGNGPAQPMTFTGTISMANHAKPQTSKMLKNPILRSQISGKVLSVLTSEGAIVEEGAPLLIIEAMKMENRINAPARVKISGIKIKAGDNVAAGVELMRFEAVDK